MELYNEVYLYTEWLHNLCDIALLHIVISLAIIFTYIINYFPTDWL